MNQVYSVSGIYSADEPEAYKRSGRAAQDDILYNEKSTYPDAACPTFGSTRLSLPILSR